ncbi:MAG: septal ring lytic transglycosylase RlpA family protein [Stenomitos rutilans HA7619-LM2]|jgi:rare lipoprotein A|nr:septal ring lytic transglycosylase RlpA family protein [Stenomitos rutilans HA7619-LM2]
MNQNVLSGLTATLFMTTLGLPLASSATPANAVNQVSEATSSPVSSQSTIPDSTQGDVASNPDQQLAQTSVSAQAAAKVVETSAFSATAHPDLQPTRAVVKLGEQQSQMTNTSADLEAIAKVQAHDLAGRNAATLYVRNIPILTFVGSGKAQATKVKMGIQQAASTTANNTIAAAKALEDTSASDVPLSPRAQPQTASKVEADASLSQNDPVLRAAAIAARINQLNREGIDAKAITVSWNTQANKAAPTGERYTIKANKTLIAIVDANTMLPDSTRSLEKDALQATNRLRRLLGNAAPLSSVSGKPNGWTQVAVGAIRQRLIGMASWYGPGFHGSPSASGEPFNQNAMTAAHRSLPFGTQVLVTNLANGQSVVVRINDRGPYAGDRVIDLSTAAARVLGLIQSGVAPVRLDVIDNSPRAITAAGN